jgi:hypothetical protein
MDDLEGTIERISSEFVWLKFKDEIANFAGVSNPAYLSLKFLSSLRVGGCGQDGELNHILIGFPVCGGRVNPNDVIEAGTPMMEDFTSQNAESLWNRKRTMVVESFLPSLIICFGHDRILAFLKEPENFALQIDDVFIGPL